MAATKQSTSFNLKGLTKSVRSLAHGSTLSSTCSFHSLSDSDDEDSVCNRSSLFDTKFVFDLDADNNANGDELGEDLKSVTKDEATAVFVTEHGYEPFAQFHCRQLEILCSD